MRLKHALKFMFRLFCAITTFETLFIAMDGVVGSGDFVLDSRDLFRIPFIAFMSVLPVLVLVRSETAPRAEWIARKAAHFVLTAGIVFTLLIYFKWVDAANALIVAAFFLAIYVAASLVQEVRARRLAYELNERIGAFHEGENATHGGKS